MQLFEKKKFFIYKEQNCTCISEYFKMSTLLKYLVILSFIALACGAPAVELQTAKDITLGEREKGDALVHTENFFRHPNPDKRIIAFRPFDVPDEYTITQVKAIDLSDGTGGYATFEYGGPGMTRVLIGFHSQINQGINYKIELYGKPYEKD